MKEWMTPEERKEFTGDAAADRDYLNFPIIEDGFGSAWRTCHANCSLCVVRPGKVQCDCDGFDNWLVSLSSRYGYNLTFEEDGDYVELRLHKADVMRLVSAMEDQFVMEDKGWMSGVDSDGKIMYVPEGVMLEDEILKMVVIS